MRAPWDEDVLSEAGMDDDFVIKALPSPMLSSMTPFISTCPDALMVIIRGTISPRFSHWTAAAATSSTRPTMPSASASLAMAETSRDEKRSDVLLSSE